MKLPPPLGEPLPGWTARPRADAIPISGRTVDLEPLDVDRHAIDLYDAAQGAGSDPNLYTYLGSGPFDAPADFRDWLAAMAADPGLGVFVVIDKSSRRAIGCASMMRMDPANGVVEIGNIFYGAALQRTTGSTEAFFLIADYVFGTLGYRRFEWKCNALHERSRRSALRFGFTFEGIFRQHMVVKGRNRDTAWFAMLDHEWESTIRPALVAWLDPANFDSAGNQVVRLESLRRELN